MEHLGQSARACVSCASCTRADQQIRCREVDWKSRWYWGLECLNAITTPEDGIGEGRETERWLKTVRISAKEVEVCAVTCWTDW